MYLRSNNASGAIHLTGSRPCARTGTLIYQIKVCYNISIKDNSHSPECNRNNLLIRRLETYHRFRVYKFFSASKNHRFITKARFSHGPFKLMVSLNYHVCFAAVVPTTFANPLPAKDIMARQSYRHGQQLLKDIKKTSYSCLYTTQI